jgi:ligand-binding sensor domain-containing protein
MRSVLYYVRFIVSIWLCTITYFCHGQLFNIGLNKGLSNSSVKYILQDSKGYIWFGTADGLNRYDGYEIKSYRNKLNENRSLPHNYIYCIEEDKQHNLYIGTGQGVGIYNRNFDSFSRLKFHPHWDKNDIQILHADAKTIQVNNNNDILIGTNGWGMFIKKTGSQVADWVPISDKNGEYSYYYHASCINITPDQRIWVFINERGLFEYSSKSNKLTLISSDILTARCISHDKNGNLYIGNNEGLHIINTKTGKYLQHLGQNFEINEVNQIAIENQDIIWIASQSGLIAFSLKDQKATRKFTNKDKAVPLSGNSVFSIFIDQDGRKWIGTSKGGVNIIDPSKYSFGTEGNIFYRNSSANSIFVRSFLEKSNNTIWIGTDGNGLQQWDRLSNTLSPVHLQGGAHLNSSIVNGILKDYTGQIWFASDKGISKYDEDGSIKYYRCISDKGVENKNFEVLYESPNKTIWAGSFINGKIYKYSRANDLFQVFAPKITDPLSLREDGLGNLWTGNYNQIIRINIATGKFKSYDVGKPVRSIFFDHNGNLWLGTEGKGLISFDTKLEKIKKTYADADGLANNSILRIEEDQKGNLWLSTFDGLSKFNPSTKEFINFDQSDGLQSNEFSYGASIKLTDGSLGFGGINGFNIFHPEKIRPVIHKPKIALTSIRINNILLNDSLHKAIIDTEGNLQKLILPFNQAILSLNFAALEFSSPQRIKYRYMLVRMDKDWNIAGSNRSINYNNLSEGNYVLHVEASDSEGKWYGREIILNIQVLPPWYRSWWAYLIYLTLIVWAIRSYMSFRNKQINLKYEIKLAKVNIEKEKEVNEKRQSFFTNISHEFRTPLTLIINPVKELLKTNIENNEKKQLNTIQLNAKRLLSLVDQLLLFRKAEEDNSSLKLSHFDFISFINEIYLCFTYQAKTQI